MIGVSGFLTFSFWAMESDPVTPEAANRIMPGLTKDEAQAILGSPPYRVDEQDGIGSEWIYGHRFKWRSFNICFGPNGLVEETYFDN